MFLLLLGNLSSMLSSINLKQAFEVPRVETDTILFHLILFVIPVVMQWMVVHMGVSLRSQLPSLQSPANQVLVTRPEKRSLEQILAEPVPSPEQFETMFSAYSAYYKVDRGLLRTIAFCESRFIPSATNGRHAGLYQFNSSTWKATRKRMDLDPDPNLRFDAEEAIKTAAFKLHNSGHGAWVVCSGKYFARS